jgi:hypothetical protein
VPNHKFLKPIPRFDKALKHIGSKYHLDSEQIWNQLKVLCEFPELGNKIPRTKGFRKYGTAVPPAINKNALRFIYIVTSNGIIPLDLYCKGEQEDLSMDALKSIRNELEEAIQESRSKRDK